MKKLKNNFLWCSKWIKFGTLTLGGMYTIPSRRLQSISFPAFPAYQLKTLCCLLVFVFCSVSFSFAQDTECGTEVTQQMIRDLLENRKNRASIIRSNTVNPVSVQVHIVTKANGTGGVSETLAYGLEAKLDNKFAAAGIDFNFCAVKYISNNLYFEIVEKGAIASQMAQENNIPSMMNIYVLPNANSSWTPLPSASPSWVMISKTGALNSSTIAHEVGHFFGLLHTHEEANGHELVLRSTVNCKNCQTAGDGFCDTPADPGHGLLPENKTLSSYVSSCVVSGIPIKDVCSISYNPNPRNLMSYGRNCRDHFTTEQIAEMIGIRNSHFSHLGSECLDLAPSSCFDGDWNGDETQEDCGGSLCNPCHCSNGAYDPSNGEVAEDCGGPCPSCPENRGLIEDHNCETGCDSYMYLNCQAVDAMENEDLVIISNVYIQNNSNNVVSGLDFSCTLVGDNGTHLLGIEPTNKTWAAKGDPNDNDKHTISHVFWYAGPNLPVIPDGAYNIRIQLLDNGNVLTSCISSSFFYIGGEGTGIVDPGGPSGPSCTDGTKNQGELEIDCGGPNCDPCPPSNSCTQGNGGLSGTPHGNYRVPSHLNAPPSGQVCILSGGESFVSIKAGNYIKIKPGFYAGYGSDFSASIASCSNSATNGPVGNSNKDDSSIISKFKVYPNPFSTLTTIELELDEEVPVSVFVSDMTGEVVTMVVDEETKSQGRHQFLFDGEALASGMYFATIVAGKHKARKKMILIR